MLCMLSNTAAIAEAWARLDHKFDLMYAKRGVCALVCGRGAWRVSSLRPGRIWLPWRRIMKVGMDSVEGREKRKRTDTSRILCVCPK